MAFSSTLALAALSLGFHPIANPMDPLMVDPYYDPTKSIAEMRVRVFPHEKVNIGQGEDARTDRVTLTLTGEGTCRVYDGLSNRPGKGSYELSTGKTFTFVQDNLPVPRWLECDSPMTLERGAGLTSHSYKGALYVHSADSAVGSSKIVEVINVLPVDDYLKGVLPSEMPASWVSEALKAQAVAARTYAYFHALLARGTSEEASPFSDLDDTDYYQVYTGTSELDERSSQAVDDTSGEALLYQGAVIQAYFHADSGGYTEDADHVWPEVNAPYCVGKKEIFSYDDQSIYHDMGGEWTVNLSGALMNQKFVMEGIVPSYNQVSKLSVTDRFPSGRAQTMTLKLRSGKTVHLDAQEFRRLFGLRSTMFEIGYSSKSTSYTIDGRGWGHGVGLNQDGSRILAEKYGWDYRKILNFYYTDVDFTSAGNTQPSR
jgi:stage II sporulation protein D